MPRPDAPPSARLATLPDRAAAEICAALLRSAGIEPRLRGESLGPYRLTIGQMAATEVWVPVAQLEDARTVLEDSELPEEAEFPSEPAAEPAARAGWGWWVLVAAALLGLLAWALAGWLF
jgi:hypothetical protein